MLLFTINCLWNSLIFYNNINYVSYYETNYYLNNLKCRLGKIKTIVKLPIFHNVQYFYKYWIFFKLKLCIVLSFVFVDHCFIFKRILYLLETSSLRPWEVFYVNEDKFHIIVLFIILLYVLLNIVNDLMHITTLPTLDKTNRKHVIADKR